MTVFLRVLEYYNGILFLTTNRVGTIDEAFKSRIHVSLYFPPLDYQQTYDIFKVNLRRLHEIEEAKKGYQSDASTLDIDDQSILRFAERHFHYHKAPQRWNGRQIRNAFQVAYSLAQFDMGARHPDDSDSDDDDAPSPMAHLNGKAVPPGQHRVILTGDQFDTVNEAIQRFDHYLLKTRGADAKIARDHNLRNDNYYDPRESERQTPGPGYSQTPQRGQYRPAPPPRSPISRPSMFSAAAQYPGYSQHDGWEDDNSPNYEVGDFQGAAGAVGAEFGNFKGAFASPRQQQQQPPYSPHPSPAAQRGARRGPEPQYDYHQGMTGGGDEHSPDDTGLNRGGSISNGRANGYGYGGH